MVSMSSIQVLIVEDEPLIAKDIERCLENIDFSSAGIAYTSEKALDILRKTQVDILVLDINIKGSMDGIQLAEQINEEFKLPFIYLTSYSDKGTVDRAKHTLPYGYIVKPFDEGDLLTSLEIAIHRFAKENSSGPIDFENFNSKLAQPLTKKEFEVLKDINEGLTNKQMAEKQFVSLNTVNTHVKNLYAKLNLHSRSEVHVFLRNFS